LRPPIDLSKNMCYIRFVMQPQFALPNPSGDFTGATLIPNPTTGFLEPDPQHRTPVANEHGGFGPLSVFDSDAKLKFIELLKTMFPRISVVCKEIGISRETFRNHLSVDVAFAKAVSEIKEEHVDEIEQVRFKVAEMPSGAFDRMHVLNAYRREIYQPSTKIEIDHKVSIDGRVDRVGNVIDGEIVRTVERLTAAKRKADRTG